MRNSVFFLFLFFPLASFAQEDSLVVDKEEDTHLHIKKYAVSDTLHIDSVSINPLGFELRDLKKNSISDSLYEIDFSKSRLILNPEILRLHDSIFVYYRKYPEFLTRKYTQFDRRLIVEDTRNLNRLYQLGTRRQTRDFMPFKGLNASGNISRGITTGNNQNTVLDSELDLQISGEISEGVYLRASIQDSNIPIQQSGYSQNLDEFDRVFIELYGDNWNIRAGDIDLVQNDSYFASYTKRVQGLALGLTLNPEENPTNFHAAGALVKGIFTTSEFRGQEGNQGPYKLTGPNGELFVLIVAGSERVFVNGIRLERGENQDYVIDYNAGEIIFNPTFPVTSEMRIKVEYQYSERSYSRIVATGGGGHQGENFSIHAFVYSENDLKNQPLRQNLSPEQVETLKNAGDDKDKMLVQSAAPDTFDENKVLYRKEIINGKEIFVYSTNPEDELFNVRFSLVGENQGDYILTNKSAITRVFEYVPPVSGVPQGNYAPIVQLFAPEKLQLAVIHGNYSPSEKTHIGFEFAGSKNDLNLFSALDDSNNDGFAGRLTGTQTLFEEEDKNKIDVFASVDYVQETFESPEQYYNIEFQRDWNLLNPLNTRKVLGNQTLLETGLEYSDVKAGFARFTFQKLDFADSYSGIRQVLQTGLYLFDSLRLDLNGSFLKSDGQNIESDFLRVNSKVLYGFDLNADSRPGMWVGGKFSMEQNEQVLKNTQELTGESQAFRSYEAFSGIGDSTGVFVEIGYRHRVNDSLRINRLQRVSRSNDYWLNSKIIHSENANLSLFANYRSLKTLDHERTEKSLNSRLLYNQFLFDRLLSLNTLYETSSGTLPQQEFTYVEVDPGQGQYTWNDYNGNGVQELEEFEIATYQDEAKFIRVFLPNQIFIKTHRNKFSQLVTLNFSKWVDENGFKGFLSHFHNQTSFLIDRKIKRDEDQFDINPFNNDTDKELAVNSNFQNTLFFNRGKQHFSTSYSFISTNTKNLLSTGLQENKLRNHQVDFIHKVGVSWVFHLKNQLTRTWSLSENFQNRNYRIQGFSVNPKVSYLLSEKTSFDLFYEHENHNNELGNLESLKRQRLGASFTFNNVQKYSITGEFNYIFNHFDGDPFSPVAYQMLQGLQPETNYTWNLIAQKKLTEFLDLNLSYFGRKSEDSKAIHTGSVQLRAYF